ncbi:PHA/PHB synthase family protein [Noviherbaspirillum autotrophicum]|uniref:PHA/PHB synthase family protein n=1 Tax=Noviherbaspirillum autotrophicum TaxID=709839 RepID=UPI000A02DA7A|nr:alpha/beta fold hydrolase [Noviherbaspirillum autotrophicum]
MDRARPLFNADSPAGQHAAPHFAQVPWTVPDIEPPATIDRLLHATTGRVTGGLSPVSLALAYADWALHLAESPGKWQRLAEKAVRKTARFNIYAAHVLSNAETEPCIEPLPQDRRFRNEAWRRWPFNLIYQGFLLHQQWWHNVTTGLGGVSPHHEQVVSFVARQLLDMVSPVNFIATNPEVLDATAREGGRNLLRGAMNFIEDLERSVGDKPPLGTEDFQPGKQVALTRGQVVYRNRLVELIQYSAATPEVHAEPVLIVPAWIMKYYILDLSPHNSLVKYLVERGHTVFMISWHNPTEHDRDLDMEDYLRLGVLEALNAVQAIVPGKKINTVGYCIGGTLLSMAAAYMAQVGDERLNTITLLAAQTDFTEAGELMLFIDDSQLNYLEDIMWKQGYLDNRQMAGAFQLLRSHDLVWSLVVRQYLLGGRQTLTDLMAWNADATRMPYRMHSEYLHRLFLRNDLFAGRYKINGRTISLGDISAPMFAVATETDHVAPWKSVYKINLIADPDVTFLLTNGGHNAGIVSQPGHTGRHYRVAHRPSGTNYIDPETWFLSNPQIEGSWWPTWVDWLERHASGQSAPPTMGAPHKGYAPLMAAPGSYVLER